jgi:hypothetical protein
MPLPLKLLYAAAELAQNERAQKAAAAVWKAGSEALGQVRAASRAPARNPASGRADPAQPPAKPARGGLWPSLEKRMRFRGGQTGDLIRFRFTDEHGLVTHRMVGNWRCEGGALIGYCLNHKSEQAFPVAFISEWEEIAVRS